MSSPIKGFGDENEEEGTVYTTPPDPIYKCDK